jgi:hypothetical protein
MNEVERFTKLKSQVQKLEVDLQVKQNELQAKQTELETLLSQLERDFGTRDVNTLVQTLSGLKTDIDSKLKTLEELVNE